MPTSISRGIRNSNPGNVNYGAFARKWGAVGLETGVPNPRFARFAVMRDGVACAAANLISYNEARGIDTIRRTIETWAPGNENDTEAYIALVCHVCDVNADDRLDFHDPNTLYWLLTAIFEEENGHDAVAQYITDADMDAGIAKALNGA